MISGKRNVSTTTAAAMPPHDQTTHPNTADMLYTISEVSLLPPTRQGRRGVQRCPDCMITMRRSKDTTDRCMFLVISHLEYTPPAPILRANYTPKLNPGWAGALPSPPCHRLRSVPTTGSDLFNFLSYACICSCRFLTSMFGSSAGFSCSEDPMKLLPRGSRTTRVKGRVFPSISARNLTPMGTRNETKRNKAITAQGARRARPQSRGSGFCS